MDTYCYKKSLHEIQATSVALLMWSVQSLFFLSPKYAPFTFSKINTTPTIVILLCESIFMKSFNFASSKNSTQYVNYLGGSEYGTKQRERANSCPAETLALMARAKHTLARDTLN